MGLEQLCPYVITPLWDSVSSSVQKDGEGIKKGPASGLPSLGSLSNKKAIKNLAAFSPAGEGTAPQVPGAGCLTHCQVSAVYPNVLT